MIVVNTHCVFIGEAECEFIDGYQVVDENDDGGDAAVWNADTIEDKKTRREDALISQRNCHAE